MSQIVEYSFYALFILTLFSIVYYFLLKFFITNSNKSLSTCQVNICLIKLAEHINEINPSLIIGVNRGGILAAVSVAGILGLDKKKLLYCYVPMIEDEPCSLIKRNNPFNKDAFEKILIIDDVCRTGRTIEKAIAYIKGEFNSLSDEKIYKTTLVSAIHVRNKSFERNFKSIYKTQYSDIRLPWHSRFNDPYIARAKDIDKKKIKQLEKDRNDEFIKLSEKSFDKLLDVVTEHLSNSSKTYL